MSIIKIFQCHKLNDLLQRIRHSKTICKVFFALFYRGIGVILQFISTIIIAQLFGAKGMGIYHIYSTWMVMLADISSLGLPIYTMRQVSALKNRQQFKLIKQLLKQYLSLGILSAAIIALPFLFISEKLSTLFLADLSNNYVLIFAAIAGIFFVTIRILSEALKALGLTNLGIVAESSFLPLGIIFSLTFYLLMSIPASEKSLLLIHISTLFIVLCLLFFLWNKIIQSKISADSATIHTAAVLPLAILNRTLWVIWMGMILNVWFVNLPVLLLPYFSSTEEIGLFGVAFRLVLLSTTILVSLSALFGPRFVASDKEDNIQQLKQDLHLSQWYSLAAYMPFFILFTLFPESILSLFGPEFIAAKQLLLILAAAQLVNSATGLVGYFLIMTHHEKAELFTLISSLLIMLTLMLLLGKLYGINGVAVAYAIGISIKNIMSLVLALFFINLRTKKRKNNYETT